MAWDWIQGGKPAAKKMLSETLDKRINAKGNKITHGDYLPKASKLDIGYLMHNAEPANAPYIPYKDYEKRGIYDEGKDANFRVNENKGLKDRYYTKNSGGEKVISSKKTGGVPISDLNDTTYNRASHFNYNKGMARMIDTNRIAEAKKVKNEDAKEVIKKYEKYFGKKFLIE